MRVNLNQYPYHDDTDMNKQYYQYLAIPGRVAQAREFTGMQTTLREIIRSIADSIMKDGDVIEGCQVLVDKSTNTVRVTEGRIYMDGIVMKLPESTVKIKGVGQEVIGIKLMEIIVTENDDNTLRDPAQGYDNFNQPGCNRLKRFLQVVVDDAESTILTTLNNGDVVVEKYAPNYDTLTQTLARRTYDESGSYIVSGLKSRVEYVSENTYNVVVESGKAYILGYELKVPTARRILSDRSQEFTEVTRSRVPYSGAGSKYYQLSSSTYVRSIKQVIGDTEKEVNLAAPGSNTAAVRLEFAENGLNVVSKITRVSSGSTIFTIAETVDASGKPVPDTADCYLRSEGNTYYLQWNNTERFPTQSYNVQYIMTKQFVEGTDYVLSTNESGGHQLEWLDNGSVPTLFSNYEVTYEQYLARKDLVYMDVYGNIEILKGAPAEYGFESLPEAPLNTLTLAYIQNPPNGSAKATNAAEMISVKNVGLTRFTMNDIQHLMNRIQTVEYDQAVLSLNDDARQTFTQNDKKGIFTDPLIDISRIDFQYNLNSEGHIVDTSKPIYDMALDLAASICYLPIVSENFIPKYNVDNSTTSQYRRLVSLRKTGERNVLSQTSATKSFNVNPYTRFPQIPEIEITPAVDNWYEDTIIEVPRSLTDYSIVSMSNRHLDKRVVIGSIFDSYTQTDVSDVDTAIGTRTTTSVQESIISEESITYIRQREITVEGSDFSPNLDLIRCYFDGKLVPLTPVDGTSGMNGYVQSDANGYFKAKFTIPAGVQTGSRQVLLKSDIIRDGEITESSALYVALGTKRRIEKTVTTVTTVLLERVRTTTVTTYIDPVGQTFVLDRMTILKGVDLYFENKPTSDVPVVCEIRGVTNGTIDEKVYTHTSLRPADVRISNNSSVATRFEFQDPVLLEENTEYAFVVRSTSSEYRIWVAELGETDVLTNNKVLQNAYLTGLMFSSSNNSSWTAHQTMDIKFNLVEDTYAQDSILEFDTVRSADVSRIYLTADTATPPGTNVLWQYSVDGINYQSITPYEMKLLRNVYSNISLRAKLSRVSNSNLSPLIALDTVSLTTSHFDKSGCYVSNLVRGLDPYTDAKIVLDVYEPSGTEISVVVETEHGLVNAVRDSFNVRVLNYGWKEVTFDTQDIASSQQFRVLIKATSPNVYSTPAFRRLRCIMS